MRILPFEFTESLGGGTSAADVDIVLTCSNNGNSTCGQIPKQIQCLETFRLEDENDDEDNIFRIPKKYTPWKTPLYIFTRKITPLIFCKEGPALNQSQNNKIILLAVNKLLPPLRNFAETHKNPDKTTPLFEGN